MSLGTKLQSVHQKVNTKLGRQDATITVRTRTRTEASTFGLPYASNTASDVSITTGARVDYVKAWEVDASLTLRVGDLKLYIPASLLTSAQLSKAEILHGSDVYSILKFQPTEIVSGVAVQWLIYARKES